MSEDHDPQELPATPPAGEAAVETQAETGTETDAEAPAREPRQREFNEPPPRDPRRRLRELLAIPDRDRPDELWDELIELEIQLAPGNRALPSQQDGGGGGGGRQQPGRRPDQGQRQDSGRRPDQMPRQDASGGAKPAKRFFKKPKRGPGAPPKPSNS